MSAFPIVIEKVSLKHRGGTKEYHAVLIKTWDNKGLVIFRWGKTGTWGPMDFHRDEKFRAESAYHKKIREKEGRGYQIDKSVTLEAANPADFLSKLGPQYYYKLGDHLNYLIPGADATGVRAETPVEWEVTPDGKHRRKEREPRRAEIEIELPPSPYDKNPLYGAF